MNYGYSTISIWTINMAPQIVIVLQMNAAKNTWRNRCENWLTNLQGGKRNTSIVSTLQYQIFNKNSPTTDNSTVSISNATQWIRWSVSTHANVHFSVWHYLRSSKCCFWTLMLLSIQIRSIQCQATQYPQVNKILKWSPGSVRQRWSNMQMDISNHTATFEEIPAINSVIYGNLHR